MFTQIKNLYTAISDQLIMGFIYLSGLKSTFSSQILFIFGSILILAGLEDVAEAATKVVPGYDPVPQGEFATSSCKILYLFRGGLGGLLVTVSGIIAIVSSAFGAFKAASAVVATGAAAFILRDLVDVMYDLDHCVFSDENNDSINIPELLN